MGLAVQEPLAGAITEVQRQWSKHDFPRADFHSRTAPHITIVPPFEMAEVDIERLITNTAKLTAQSKPLDCKYAFIEVFNRRIIHIAIESNSMLELRARLYRLGQDIIGIRPDTADFHPHATVAYAQEPLDEPGTRHLKQYLGKILNLPQQQKATAVQIFGRQQSGQNYRTLADMPLALDD